MDNGARGLDWTGERYLPWVDDAVLHYEHLHRYRFASQWVEGKRVLDLASGEGYGAAMLARSARSVVGIDNDLTAVCHARKRYGNKRLDFFASSILEIAVSDRLFDVIVCFEAIEHVDSHQTLLSEIARLLAPDGLLLISTPNRAVYSDAEKYKNPFHLKELYLEEFEHLLAQRFEHVDIRGQMVLPGSYIFSRGGAPNPAELSLLDRTADGFEFRANNASAMRYFVAAASQREIAELPQSVVIDLSRSAFQQMLEVERRAQRTESESRDYQNKLEGKFEELEVSQRELNARYQELEARNHELERVAAERSGALEAAQEYAQRVSAQLEKIEAAYRVLEEGYRAASGEHKKLEGAYLELETSYRKLVSPKKKRSR